MFEPYVYAITDSTNIKIGVARKPLTRLKALSTGNAAKLILLGYFHGGFKLEKEIHRKYQKVRENGEWLYPSDELIAYLNSMIHDKLIVNNNGIICAYLKISNF